MNNGSTQSLDLIGPGPERSFKFVGKQSKPLVITSMPKKFAEVKPFGLIAGVKGAWVVQLCAPKPFPDTFMGFGTEQHCKNVAEWINETVEPTLEDFKLKCMKAICHGCREGKPRRKGSRTHIWKSSTSKTVGYSECDAWPILKLSFR